MSKRESVVKPPEEKKATDSGRDSLKTPLEKIPESRSIVQPESDDDDKKKTSTKEDVEILNQKSSNIPSIC